MRNLFSLVLVTLLTTSLLIEQSKIGGTAQVGGTANSGPGTAAVLNAKVGSFTEPGSTGNQATTGVGFLPKVVLFWWNRAASDGTSANAELGFGVGVSSSSRRAISNLSTDNASPSSATITKRISQCIYLGGGAGIADFVSQDSDGFTVNWSVVSGTNIVVNYLALGGGRLTDVGVGTSTVATSTGNQALTGVGFQPQALMVYAGRWNTTDDFDGAGTSSNLFGIATASAQGLVSSRMANGVNPSSAQHRQSTATLAVQVGAGTIAREGSLVSLDSDGYTVNWTTVSASADGLYYLALRGPSVKVGTFNQATSTGNQAVTGVGFQAKALILLSANDISANNDTVANDAQISVGAATGPSARFAIWSGAVHNVNPTQADRNLDRTKVIKMFSPGTPTLNAAADFVSFDSDGFTVNWTTADGTARQILYLVLG